jgi:hypothetical protein
MDVNTPVDNSDAVIASHCNEAIIRTLSSSRPIERPPLHAGTRERPAPVPTSGRRRRSRGVSGRRVFQRHAFHRHGSSRLSLFLGSALTRATAPPGQSANTIAPGEATGGASPARPSSPYRAHECLAAWPSHDIIAIIHRPLWRSYGQSHR